MIQEPAFMSQAKIIIRYYVAAGLGEHDMCCRDPKDRNNNCTLGLILRHPSPTLPTRVIRNPGIRLLEKEADKNMTQKSTRRVVASTREKISRWLVTLLLIACLLEFVISFSYHIRRRTNEEGMRAGWDQNHFGRRLSWSDLITGRTSLTAPRLRKTWLL